MKGTLLVVCAIFMSFNAFSAFGQDRDHLPTTGEDLYPILKIMSSASATRNSQPLSRSEIASLVWATGFLSGVTQGMRVQAYEAKKDISCMDASKTTNQIIAAKVVAFIDKHPDYRSQPAIASVSMAMFASYPCFLQPAKS